MNKKYKILYIVSTLKRSGPTNQLYGIISNLDRNKFEPYILTLSPEEHDTRIEEFTKLKLNIYSLNLSRIKMVFSGKKLLLEYVNEIRPDIIHTSGIRADFYVHKYLNEYLHCNTLHNYPYEDYIMTYGNIKGFIIATTHMKILREMKYPIACSKSITEKIFNNHGFKIEYVQNGVDEKQYRICTFTEKNVLRKKLNIDVHKIVIISSGNLSERKDPITLLRAFNQADLKSKAQLLVLGDGPLEKECKEFENNSIKLIGRVENVHEYLMASDIFVSASKAEGLPMAVLEAIASGLYVILSNIDSHIEVLEKDHNIGEIFKVEDVNQLTEILNNICNIDLKTKAMQIRNVFEKYFTAKIMSQSYQRIYERILLQSLKI
ncbi:glycosyltransferase family 4 protein [Defluviitalea raffinosedens]|nr:glycosyltransferase family 4 protein [Defluviitalea raffinosedens]